MKGVLKLKKNLRWMLAFSFSLLTSTSMMGSGGGALMPPTQEGETTPTSVSEAILKALNNEGFNLSGGGIFQRLMDALNEHGETNFHFLPVTEELLRAAQAYFDELYKHQGNGEAKKQNEIKRSKEWHREGLTTHPCAMTQQCFDQIKMLWGDTEKKRIILLHNKVLKQIQAMESQEQFKKNGISKMTSKKFQKELQNGQKQQTITIREPLKVLFSANCWPVISAGEDLTTKIFDLQLPINTQNCCFMVDNRLEENENRWLAVNDRELLLRVVILFDGQYPILDQAYWILGEQPQEKATTLLQALKDVGSGDFIDEEVLLQDAEQCLLNQSYFAAYFEAFLLLARDQMQRGNETAKKLSQQESTLVKKIALCYLTGINKVLRSESDFKSDYFYFPKGQFRRAEKPSIENLENLYFLFVYLGDQIHNGNELEKDFFFFGKQNYNYKDVKTKKTGSSNLFSIQFYSIVFPCSNCPPILKKATF